MMPAWQGKFPAYQGNIQQIQLQQTHKARADLFWNSRYNKQLATVLKDLEMNDTVDNMNTCNYGFEFQEDTSQVIHLTTYLAIYMVVMLTLDIIYGIQLASSEAPIFLEKAATSHESYLR